MFTIPNHFLILIAYNILTFRMGPKDNRLKPSSNQDRLVDCMEELVKYTIVMRPHFHLFGDRYSEREERRSKEEATRKTDIESQSGMNNDANGLPDCGGTSEVRLHTLRCDWLVNHT